MNKYLSVIVIFTLIIIIYFCNNIENFTTSTNPAATDPVVTDPVVTDPATTIPATTIPATQRKPYNKYTLNKYMGDIQRSLSYVLSLQNQNYIDELRDEERTDILNELKDNFNQKNIISESVIDISQRLQDKDIEKLQNEIQKIKTTITKPESNYVKHISTGKVFEILNDPNNTNNNQYLEVNKDLNLCLSHKHNKLTNNDIQKMIDDKEEVENINLEHCDFDSDKQYIYLSNKIKNPDNSDFNNELHESCKQYSSLSENSKLNNYPFYHLYPEDYDNNLDLKDKKYCLTLDNEHMSIEKCSGKNSQRFLKV
tara:strand:+ start:7622 stop:8557 length:936 start_codon:yes stop_codon:yes gene_type:complete